MKVLYLSHTSLISGAEGALLDLLAALPEMVSPIVMCPPGALAETVRQRGVEVAALPGVSGSFRLHPVHTPRTAAELALAGRALRRTVRSTGVELVHANTLRAGLIAGCGLTSRRIPVVVHAHDALPPTNAGRVVGAALRACADAVIAVSDYTAAPVSSGSRPQVHVLYNPLDTERFDPERRSRAAARAELGLPADEPLLGLVAQITPWKGHELAIRTLARLIPRFPGLRLLIVGEAKFNDRATRYDNIGYLESLHRLVAELGIEQHVEFWGERDDVDTITRALDVLLNPSWEEPFGRSVIEAMALRTAVVATNVGGPSEYIEDGVDGILLAPRDPVAWADAVARLLEDPARRAEIGQRASTSVRRRFDRRRYASRVVEIYEQILADARSLRPRARLTLGGLGASPASGRGARCRRQCRPDGR